jgi:cytoskeletal protein CcmA (bactofilin family)
MPKMEVNNNTVTIISQGTEITGDIKSSGDIRIDGTLNGNMIIKGKVVIGSTGYVKGEIECKDSEVSGMINGKISVSQLLNLKVSSKMIGTINTTKLSIESGAIFTGNCLMKDINEDTSNLKEKRK